MTCDLQPHLRKLQCEVSSCVFLYVKNWFIKIRTKQSSKTVLMPKASMTWKSIWEFKINSNEFSRNRHFGHEFGLIFYESVVLFIHRAPLNQFRLKIFYKNKLDKCRHSNLPDCLFDSVLLGVYLLQFYVEKTFYIILIICIVLYWLDG